MTVELLPLDIMSFYNALIWNDMSLRHYSEVHVHIENDDILMTFRTGLSVQNCLPMTSKSTLKDRDISTANTENSGNRNLVTKFNIIIALELAEMNKCTAQRDRTT